MNEKELRKWMKQALMHLGALELVYQVYPELLVNNPWTTLGRMQMHDLITQARKELLDYTEISGDQGK